MQTTWSVTDVVLSPHFCVFSSYRLSWHQENKNQGNHKALYHRKHLCIIYPSFHAQASSAFCSCQWSCFSSKVLTVLMPLLPQRSKLSLKRKKGTMEERQAGKSSKKRADRQNAGGGKQNFPFIMTCIKKDCSYSLKVKSLFFWDW